MAQDRRVTLYYAPQTRAEVALNLMEEIGEPYDLKVMNQKNGETRQPAYLAVNPMGKVPAIKHGDAVVTEQAAVFMYLADLFPEKGLAPPIGHVLRGPYLRWMVFYGSAFEPAVVDKAMKREAGEPAISPYGDYDTMLKTLTDQLAKGPYLLGDKLFALDILWGNGLAWTTMFGMVPKTPVIEAYIARVTDRPAAKRAAAKSAELVAKQAA